MRSDHPEHEQQLAHMGLGIEITRAIHQRILKCFDRQDAKPKEKKDYRCESRLIVRQGSQIFVFRPGTSEPFPYFSLRITCRCQVVVLRNLSISATAHNTTEIALAVRSDQA